MTHETITTTAAAREEEKKAPTLGGVISDVPFFSSLHGRERRALRGIDRLALQAAVKYGHKESGWPDPTTGAARWKYTHADTVYITDASSTREVTSYGVPIDIPHPPLTGEHCRAHEAAKQRLERDPSLCTSHTVIVVDQSGSMKTSDVFDFKNRSQAVFGMLALDFVAKQRLSREGSDTDVVSLVLMRDSAEVVFEREPMGLVLYGKFVGLHDDGKPRSHGHYLPALAAAEELLAGEGTHGCCALSLLFLSDGKPSDQIVCYDGESYQGVVDSITDRVRSLAGLFGQQLCVTTLGVARRDGDFSVLQAMADAARDAGAHGEFHRPELSSEGLSTAIASSVLSLTTTRRRLTTLASEGRQPRKLRQVEREAAGCQWGHAPTTADLTGGGWVVYTDRVRRYVYSTQAKQDTDYPWVAVSPFSEEANGIAIRTRAFGEGAERLVYGLQEIDSRGGPSTFVGPKLVAKESRHVGEESMKMDFHESFAKTQLKAKSLALKFNGKVRDRLNLRGGLPAAPRVWDVTFVDCSVYEFAGDESSMLRGVLVEKLLEPAKGYTKWNGNNGYVHGEGASTAIEPSVQQHQQQQQVQHQQQTRLEGNLDAVQEEDEDESDSDSDGSVQSTKGDTAGNTVGDTACDTRPTGDADTAGKAGKAGMTTRFAGTRGHGVGGGRRGGGGGGGGGGGRAPTKTNNTPRAPAPFAPTAQCYVQAFSHFTYRHTRRKMLVCDLQGVLNTTTTAADEGRAGVFELTDPVIHYRSDTDRQQVYGKTDLGSRGTNAFFATHECNDVCRLLGLRPGAK